MHYVVLTTGSCGNCYIFYENNDAIIIDDGVTYKKLTHLHPDHAKGVGPFMRKTKKPVYVSARSHRECRTEIEKQKIDYNDLRTFEHGETVEAGSFKVTSFRTSHDSAGSSGYYIENDSGSVFLMTDTGKVPDDAFSYARGFR